MATYLANLCPLSGRAEFAGFGEDLDQPIRESIEAASRRAVRQGSAEHFGACLAKGKQATTPSKPARGEIVGAFGCGARWRGCERARWNSRCRSFEATST